MYAHVVLGGTFDGLHKGHVTFLKRAFEEGELVTIGLTSEAYVRRFKNGKGVSPFSRRYQALTRFLRNAGVASRTTIVPLDNRWGPAVLGQFDAILVTHDNAKTADEINLIRKERGLPPLFIISVPLVPARDFRELSSTRIRLNEIDRNGDLIMPDNLRGELKNPLGRLLTGEAIASDIKGNRDNIIITVGDIATETVFSFGVKPALAVIDLRVERKPYGSFEALKFPKQYEIVQLTSGPGYVAKDAVKVIVDWSKTVRSRRRVALIVDGEEDLLTIPAIVYAPLGSVVYYGNPPSTGRPGLVAVDVTKRKKSEIEKLLEKFV